MWTFFFVREGKYFETNFLTRKTFFSSTKKTRPKSLFTEHVFFVRVWLSTRQTKKRSKRENSGCIIWPIGYFNKILFILETEKMAKKMIMFKKKKLLWALVPKSWRSRFMVIAGKLGQKTRSQTIQTKLYSEFLTFTILLKTD